MGDGVPCYGALETVGLLLLLLLLWEAQEAREREEREGMGKEGRREEWRREKGRAVVEGGVEERREWKGKVRHINPNLLPATL